MPIYEYRCEDCGRTTESLQKVSDPPLEECPHCHRPALKRLMSATVFRLKGKGWYETDFKSGDQRNVYDAPEGGKAPDATPTPAPAAGEGAVPAKKDPVPAAASAPVNSSTTSTSATPPVPRTPHS
jgi:putative FmdB family regulatory protein